MHKAVAISDDLCFYINKSIDILINYKRILQLKVVIHSLCCDQEI